MSNLTILKTAIRTFENLYSLNDLHIASGAEAKHQPSLFIRLDATQELISEIQKETDKENILQSFRSGVNRGTYACEELVIAYAMWISPKFHLIVLRAFLAMHRNQPQQLALPEPQKFTHEFTEFEIETLVWLLIGHHQMNTLLGQLEKPLDAIGSNLHPTVYSYWKEYGRQYKDALPTIKRLMAPFKQSNRLNWERAQHLINQ